MINVLSYIGMNVHSEVCLWTLLGLIRTIFDATLFRVNANLKQVWQMSMPEELSMPVQRVLRTMISGVMLVQCFTVYVYLASYIVLLYPVFLEERPNLVLPWLLLAAVRKLLCELTSLALGLGTCVLVGAARPACIKFVIFKLISIMPAFYMWMLLYSYYHNLKVSSAFKTLTAVMAPGHEDYGLELAIRRRLTKSLLKEDELRSKIVASLYGERNSANGLTKTHSQIGITSRMMHSTDTSAVDLLQSDTETEVVHPNSFSSNQLSDPGYEDWFGSVVVLPRSCDRILEQFVLMLLRIKAYLDREALHPADSKKCNEISSLPTSSKCDHLNCSSISTYDTETPLFVGSSRPSNTASYLIEYPQIFGKKPSDASRSDTVGQETGSLDVEKAVKRRKHVAEDKNSLINQQRKPNISGPSHLKQTNHSSEIKQLDHKNITVRKNSSSGSQIKETMIKLHSEDSVQSIRQCRKKSSVPKNGVLLEEPSHSGSESADEQSDVEKKENESKK